MIITLSFLSFLTAIVSAATGMAGGVLLLSAMSLFIPFYQIIPIHGAVQLTSNCSRSYYLRHKIDYSKLFFYSLGLPLGASITIYILQSYINETIAFFLLSLLIFYVLFKPKKLPSIKLNLFSWVLVGLITGILALTVGSVGPFLSVFFINDKLSKEQIVANKSSMQLMAHLIKVPSFLYLGFNYLEHWKLILLMALFSVAGNKFGLIVLRKINEKKFRVIFKMVLFAALIRLLYKAMS
ncbi:MAG: sulfite exporter TauE/SafE family protein [Bacteriovoracaceae bacterium]|jgi:uncharacterized membrane protein YfcA|nr:sulfite exporter TauE/SafE family protein [Bacteriovoracaceae bacterium]